MGHITDSDASHRPPFGCQLVLGFLVLDALDRVIELGRWLWAYHQTTLSQPLGSHAVNIPVFGLWILVDILLAILLVLRTRFGRWFTVVIFGLHAGYLAHVLGWTSPELWMMVGSWGRGRVALTLVIDVALMAYLLGPTARAWLNVR